MLQSSIYLPSFGDGVRLRMVRGGVSAAAVFHEVFSASKIEGPPLIHTVKMNPSLPLAALRHLATQSLNLFESIQNMIEFDLESVVLKSREYRSILAECEEEIVTEIKLIDEGIKCDEDRYNLLTTQCNTIRDYQLLWHLAEIFFIKISSGGYLIQDLTGWLILQQPHVSFNYNQLMDYYNNANGDIKIEKDKNYWPTVLCLTMHGRLSELVKLLMCHTLSNSQAFREIRSIIELLPVYGQNFVKSEFELLWKKWRIVTQERIIDSCILRPYPQLLLLANILLGKQEAYFAMEVIDAAEGCWYYAVVSYFLYSQPLINVKEISNTYKNFKRCFQRALISFENISSEVCSKEILQTVNAAFNIDLGEFIGVLSRNTNNWWLPAHLIDIIEKINPHLFLHSLPPINDSDIFNEYSVHNEVCSMKEFFVLRYSSELVSYTSLTLTALSYMHYCPVLGASQIFQIIDHLYLPTDRFAKKVHSWCLQHQYENISLLICKRQAVANFKRNDLGNSLSWSIRGKDSSFVSRIADTLLKAVLLPDNDDKLWMDTVECVKNISLGVCGKKMTFVIQFYEVKLLIKEQKYKEALASLIQLLQCSLVASHYNLDILRIVKPLFNVEGLLKTNDIHLLMECLEEARGSEAEMNDLRRLMVIQMSRACLL